MALQFSLQNMLDLVKYVVTMILNQPSEFKCTCCIPTSLHRRDEALTSRSHQGPS